MDLSIPEAESLLASTVRSFVTRVATTEVLVKVQESTSDQIPEWTRAMADAGWLGAIVPADLGGSDASCLQAAVICEELGRGPVPGPFLVSSVLSALILRAAEPTAYRDELLAAIARGDTTVVPVFDPTAWSPTGLHLSTELAGLRNEGLSATVPFVPYAQASTHLLVPLAQQDGHDGVEFVIVPAGAPGVATRRLQGFLGWNDEVTFTDVRLGSDTVLCRPSRMAEALSEAYALVAAYMVGGCQVLLERCVDYSNTRIQFSKPIGQFQRVQDHIVELVNALDSARWSTYQAIWQIDSERDARVGAHMALAVASEAYVTCTDAAHKVHGGIGVDPQFGLTLYTQMARSLYWFLGKPLWHKRQMASTLGWESHAVTTPDVHVELDESTHVGTIEMRNGPHNFLDGDVLASVVEASHELAHRGGRALVLCSGGKNFCGGASFASGAGPGGGGAKVYGLGLGLLEQPLPIVAALQGSTIGGGVGLALVADLRVASPQSRFSTNFALLGFHHGFGLSVTLPLVVGPQSAIELLYTGRRINGEEAHRIGLCDYLVPADQIRHRAAEIAAEIAAAAPLATQAIRRTLRGHLANEMRAAMADELVLQQELMATDDFAEGTTAVNERRPGKFTGR